MAVTYLWVTGLILLIIGIIAVIAGIAQFQSNVTNNLPQPWWVFALIVGGIILILVGAVLFGFGLIRSPAVVPLIPVPPPVLPNPCCAPLPCGTPHRTLIHVNPEPYFDNMGNRVNPPGFSVVVAHPGPTVTTPTGTVTTTGGGVPTSYVATPGNAVPAPISPGTPETGNPLSTAPVGVVPVAGPPGYVAPVATPTLLGPPYGTPGYVPPAILA